MIPVKVLAVRFLANADSRLAGALGATERDRSMALLTTVRLDSDTPV